MRKKEVQSEAVLSAVLNNRAFACWNQWRAIVGKKRGSNWKRALRAKYQFTYFSPYTLSISSRKLA